MKNKGREGIVGERLKLEGRGKESREVEKQERKLRSPTLTQKA